jgi:hypothetical protein
MHGRSHYLTSPFGLASFAFWDEYGRIYPLDFISNVNAVKALIECMH